MWNTIYHNSQRQETLWKKAPFRIGNLIISSFFNLRPNISRPPCFVGKIYQEPILAIHSDTCQLCTSDTQVNLQLFLLTLSILTNWQKNKVQYFNRRISISIWVARKRQIYFCIQNHCLQKARHPQSTQYLWQISQVRKAKRWKPNLITNC